MGISFSALCRAHAAIDLATGAGMLLALDRTAQLAHGRDVAAQLLGAESETHSLQVLNLRASESLVGLLLVDIGLVLGVVATSKDARFQRNFSCVALGTHALMALWRFRVESRLPALKKDWKSQLVGDVLLASSWCAFLWQQARNAKSSAS